jgi:hypothetical protein
MDDNKKQIEELKSQIELLKMEVENRNQQPILVQQHNPQDKFVEEVVSKGSEIFGLYLQSKLETERLDIEKSTDYAKEELKTVDGLDKRDKYYKGLLIVICFAFLGFLAYADKTQNILPVVTLIIGYMLKSNSISEFFSMKKQLDKEE